MDLNQSRANGAALGRYQIRNGLPITGQLDAETSKALGAKPAVATTADRSCEEFRGVASVAHEPNSKAPANSRETIVLSHREKRREAAPKSPPRSAPAAATPISSESTQPASAPPATVSDTGSSGAGDQHGTASRDYVGAYVSTAMVRAINDSSLKSVARRSTGEEIGFCSHDRDFLELKSHSLPSATRRYLATLRDCLGNPVPRFLLP